MEDQQNLANLAFESFLAQDYMACTEIFKKFKTAGDQNDKDAHQIKLNSLILEFAGGKVTDVSNLATKIEELLAEVRSQNPTLSKTDPNKAPGDLDEDLSGPNGQEIDDSWVLKYNYAVALQLAGKKYQSVALLEELFQNKGNVDDYILLKATFTYLELAITQKDYAQIKTIMEFLEKVKKYIGIARANPLSLHTDLEEGKETLDTATEPANQEKASNEIQNYSSLIFGSEIYKHGARPTNICRLEFNFILTIYQIYLLISLKETELARKKLNSCRILFNYFTKVIKDGKDEKGNINGRYVPTISPYIDRHSNILFSFARAYFAYHTQSYAECMKLLNTIEILTFFGEEIPSYTAFQLNNIACCHLRMKKYSLAAYYLSKALTILQKLSRETSDNKKYEKALNLNAVQQYPLVLHNYALATLQMGKFDEAAEAYSSLAEFWPDNVKVWYRIALCHLNKCQEILAENQTQRKNGIYQALLDSPNYTILVEDEKSEQTKSRKTEEIEHKENPYYTRYILQVRDNTLQKTEEESGGTPGPKFVNQNPDLNKGNEGTPPNLTDKQLRMHLEKAARCFRNTVLIIKKKKVKQQKEQQVQVPINFQDPSEGEDESKQTEGEVGEGEEEKEKSVILKPTRNAKDYQDILQSSLAYLAYTSLSLGEINNTINYAKECLDLPFITDETKYICLMYLVEAYCFLGNQKEVSYWGFPMALNQMNSANVTQTILTVARNALGINQAYFTKNLSSKVVIYTNLATAHILNNNLTGAQNAINIALSNIDPALLQVPISLLNLMIYLNLKLDKPETALQILKRRRILNSGTNKLLLRIVKWMN